MLELEIQNEHTTITWLDVWRSLVVIDADTLKKAAHNSKTRSWRCGAAEREGVCLLPAERGRTDGRTGGSSAP